MTKIANFAIILFCGLCTLLSPKLFACSCDGGLTFCEATTGTDNDLVVAGEIVYVDSLKLLLNVIDIFKGEENKDTITIWAGTDFNCNGLFSMTTYDLGEKGDSIVIILPKIKSGNLENDWDVIGDYRRPNYLCISASLRLKNDSVYGEIKDKWPIPNSTIWQLPYEYFKSSWIDGNINCSNLVKVNEVQNTTADICYEHGNLFIDNCENLNLRINVYSQTGKLLYSIQSSNSQVLIPDQKIDRQTFIVVQIYENDKLLKNEKIAIKN